MERRNKFFIVFSVVILMAIVIGAISYVLIDEEGTDRNQSDTGRILEKISIHRANEIINENSNLIILDVRTPNEFEDGRLNDSINIDFYSETFRNELNKLDKNGTYVIYCRSGNRSGQTFEIMNELGFMEVYDFGSFVEWEGAGYDTVSG